MLESPAPETALTVHTYSGTRVDVRGSGIPVEIRAEEPIEKQLDKTWRALSMEARILAFVQSLDDLDRFFSVERSGSLTTTPPT
jgi:hypothetical protein